MFDLGWPELMLIMVVALIVIGPKELPNAIRTVTGVVRKVRAAAREFQSGIDDLARESGLDDVKKQFDDIEYYDPEAALDNISESDEELLDLADAEDANSILDPEARRVTEKKNAADTSGDGEGSGDVPPDTAPPEAPASEFGQDNPEASETASEAHNKKDKPAGTGTADS